MSRSDANTQFILSRIHIVGRVDKIKTVVVQISPETGKPGKETQVKSVLLMAQESTILAVEGQGVQPVVFMIVVEPGEGPLSRTIDIEERYTPAHGSHFVYEQQPEKVQFNSCGPAR